MKGLRHKLLRTLIVLSCMLAPSAGSASLFDTYGLGARSTAMANSVVALSRYYESVYYNPANLLARKTNHLGISFNGLFPTLTLEPTEPTDDFHAVLPSSIGGITLGTSVPLGGVFKNKVGLGVVFFHPLGDSTRVESLDPQIPYYYRYQSLPSKFILAAALAFEPISWLKFGVGTQLLAQLGGEITTSLSLSERRFTGKTVDLEIKGTTALTAGLTVGPFAGLQLGVTWRSPLELSYLVPIEVELEEVGLLYFVVDGISLYTPGQLAIGLSWESHPGKNLGLAIELGLTWERWSLAPPAGALFIMTVDNAAIANDEEVQKLISSQSNPLPLEARDIVTPRLGVEYRPNRYWAARLGYLFRPTPLPVPVHETNTIDATAHVVSLGGGYTFADPTRISEKPLTLDLALQITALKSRRIPKIEGPHYRAAGVIWNLSVDLRHNY